MSTHKIGSTWHNQSDTAGMCNWWAANTASIGMHTQSTGWWVPRTASEMGTQSHNRRGYYYHYYCAWGSWNSQTRMPGTHQAYIHYTRHRMLRSCWLMAPRSSQMDIGSRRCLMHWRPGGTGRWCKTGNVRCRCWSRSGMAVRMICICSWQRSLDQGMHLSTCNCSSNSRASRMCNC